MIERELTDVIGHAMILLEEEGLAPSSLAGIMRVFKQVAKVFKEKNEIYYTNTLMSEIEEGYQRKLLDGAISEKHYKHLIRSTKILCEVYETSEFQWRVLTRKSVSALSEDFEQIVVDLVDPNYSKSRNKNIQSIVRQFFLYLNDLGISSLHEVSAENIQMFLRDISETWAKSKDHVIDALRVLNRFLISTGMPGLPHVGLLMAPRARERKIHPCMPQEDLETAIKAIDRATAIGKRDYAVLLLAASTGLRSGDITKIELSDIDWRKNNIQVIQGKTQFPIYLPLQKGVGSALADYILNGRPESKSSRVFLRSVAPYQGLTSVQDILRRWIKLAGVERKTGDGKTFHGIRRMLGTNMVIAGIPVTTVSQVLGHQRLNATRQYISLDIEGLRECALGFASIGEDFR